ncbi:Tetrachloroethene reductive dehalogenase TceA [Dehalococcoides mccartyi]|jgi:reductive dehalogenase|uniref:Tetrachloroethene reductive dehalogenase TceA n=2 Tax=Dehalococcoides TaxID=61434 RepID=A0A328ENQ0_9CHLR|nr:MULTISPECIES: reductive dehalogenase [Dehalococcoides]UZH91479.1 reductive dehalogenase [uncultured bacterium]PKH45605.1 reductive dehalogenase [Dehalococcoides mccartyi]RAL68971.1 Tetrachloroethene reductive dehalogenase TceA [Dehalococcoides mccartyi]RAL70156.1 Tetrachloroethene reductive dehalogenase TceA [Dehalococcoides mccartyi]BAS32455.1 reductive dehalogenase [Dehalococcoides mccartyi IBARAKI]
MHSFHSTVSRRDFMKTLGLASAGIGATAAISPVFHDMDEVIASPTAGWKRAWFVKEVDEPTLEIDWNQIHRMDRRGQPGRDVMAGRSDGYYSYYLEIEEFVKKEFPDWKGTTLRDRALNEAWYSTWMGTQTVRTPAPTPDQLSGNTSIGPMPKWQGTPEENLRTIRAAFRSFGVSSVTVAPVDEKTRKLFYSYVGKQKVTFEDIDLFESTADRFAIPNNCQWVIHWTNLQDTELTSRMPSHVGRAGFPMAYTHVKRIDLLIEQFLRGLGYQSINAGNYCPSAAFGIMTGVGEHTRMGTTLNSPEYGSHLRGQYRVVTDLPLAITKPIDAGMERFCETCGVCGTQCPFGAIAMGDKSWDNACGQDWASDQSVGGDTCMWNIPGYNGWRLDYRKCMGNCCSCMGACPFGTAGASIIHEVVKGTMSVTPVFNSFFRSMSETFNYGHKEPESWWDLPLEQIPAYGVNPALLVK